MAVRNFYVNGVIDGRNTDLAGGPARKDGGMELAITQRNNNGITRAFTIVCRADNNKLFSEVYDNSGKLVSTFETER